MRPQPYQVASEIFNMSEEASKLDQQHREIFGITIDGVYYLPPLTLPTEERRIWGALTKKMVKNDPTLVQLQAESPNQWELISRYYMLPPSDYNQPIRPTLEELAKGSSKEKTNNSSKHQPINRQRLNQTRNYSMI